jgi:DNA-binding GntR family transcriptional regulator
MTSSTKKQPQFHDTPLIVQVYEWLRDSICAGEYEIDSRLNIDQLSQDWGISKTPIREALSALCKDGLVDYAHRQGFFVKRLNFRELMDTLELREALEFYSLGHYFETYDRSHLKTILADFERTFKIIQATGSASEYLEVDADFHTFLVQSTGNQKITETYRVLDTNLRYMRLQDTNFLNELAGATISEHKTIIEAILHDNRSLALSALKEHLHNVRDRLIKLHASESAA